VCGLRIFPTYTENGREVRYVCHRLAVAFGEPRCQPISAQYVVACVAAAMLDALTPGAIAVSLLVAKDLDLERRRLYDQWKLSLQRAALARRGNDSIDPSNRFIDRTLKQD
jgi:hypothetical protein